MKRVGVFLLALLCCAVFSGAASAPVAPTKGFYVNDYAGVLFKEHRTLLTELAVKYYEETGVQIVLLAVNDLADLPAEEYAKSIMEAWDIGGRDRSGVLILFSENDALCHIRLGEGIYEYINDKSAADIQEEFIQPYFKDANYSTGLLEGYKALGRKIYGGAGLVISEEMAEILQPRTVGFRINTPLMVFCLVAFLAVARCLYVYNRNRKKYLYRHQPSHRSHSAKRNADDDMPMVHQIDVDEDNPRASVKRSGFIIYREDDAGGHTGDDTQAPPHK